MKASTDAAFDHLAAERRSYPPLLGNSIAGENRIEEMREEPTYRVWARLLAEQKGASLGGAAVRLQCTTLRRRVLTTPT